MNKKCLAILFVMTLALILAFAPRVRANPIDISFEPTSGTVGTLVSVSGNADTENGFVDIYWDFPGNVFKTVQAEGFDYGGEIEIPEAVAGTHALGAKDVQAGQTTAGDFIVISDFSLTPNIGRIGLTVTVSGTGFANSSSVEITWDDPAQTVLTTASNENGTFGGSFIVPSSLAGDHTVTATDEDENTASDTFTVLPITISIDPSSGPVGTEVTVTGSYATPGELVSILWDDVEDDSTTADGVGDYSYLLTVPPDLAGEHTITAVDVMSTNNASETFTLLPITISIDPISGPVGTIVAVTGTYATPERSVAIQWDGVVVDTVEALLNGNYSYELTIPPATNGDHTITAVDTESTNTASETFTVIALITLDPEDGLVGQLVDIEGTGFSGNSKVDVYFGDIEEPVLQVNTDEYGSFSGTFTVPWVPTAGNYEVLAIDENEVNDDAVFTVLFVMYTRSDEYFQGDYPSFFIQAVNEEGEPLEGAWLTMNIYDSNGYLQYKGVTFTVEDGTVPYDMQFFSWAVWNYAGSLEHSPPHLPSDALIGTWTATAELWDGELTVSDSFEVVEPVDLRTLLDMLDQLLDGQDDISNLIAYYGDKLQLEHDELAELIVAVSNELQLDHEELTNLINEVAGKLQLEHEDIIALIGEVADNLEMKLDDLSALVSDVADKLQMEHEDLADLISQVADKLQMEHEDLANLIASVAEDLDLVHEDLVSLITETADKLQIEHENLIELISSVAEKLQMEHTELAELVTEVFDELEIKLDNIKAEIIDIEKKVDGLYLVIGDLEVKLDDINPILTDIQGRIGTIETDIGTIKTDISNINGKIASIEGTLATIDTDIGTIQVDIASINAKLVDLQGDIATIDTEVGEIEVKAEQINATVTAIYGKIAVIESTVGVLEDLDISAINATLEDIQGRTATIQTTLGTVQQDISNINGELAAIKGNIATITTDIGTIKTDVSNINGKIVSIEGDTATIQTDVGTIKTSLEDVNAKIKVNKDNIATIQTDIGTIKGRLTSIEGNVATIETDIGTIQTETDKIESIKTDTSLQPATVALSLIAAIAAIAAAVMVLRKVYVK